MAVNSSIFAWKTPWTEEPGGLQSIEVTKCWAWLNTHNTHPNRYLCILWNYFIVVIQSLSHVQFFVTPVKCRMPSFTISQSLLKVLSIESMMSSNDLILFHPLLFLLLIFPNIRVFSNKSVLHIKWPKYWSFSFSNSPSSEYSGLISFSIDWCDLLAAQGALKSLLQHHRFFFFFFFFNNFYFILYVN